MGTVNIFGKINEKKNEVEEKDPGGERLNISFLPGLEIFQIVRCVPSIHTVSGNTNFELYVNSLLFASSSHSPPGLPVLRRGSWER